MGDHRDYVALDWVKGEIGETLQQATSPGSVCGEP